MPDVGLDFEDLTRVRGGVAPQIFPVVGNIIVVVVVVVIIIIIIIIMQGRCKVVSVPN
jgi:hypothetical protein